jgi:hypothetical protein
MPKWLTGWKTYTAGAIMVLFGIQQCNEGNTSEGVKCIIEGIAIISGRQAIGNLAKQSS